MGRATPWDPEVDELERSLKQIEVELRGDLDALLVCRLVTVLNRQCPLRSVGASPIKDTARLRFADGLSVIAHSPEGSALLRLLLPLHRGASVLLERVERTDDGVLATLRWAPHHSIRAVVTGFDQVD
ncbi:hypothetical protein GCM10028820_06270 [Tessaracoccus terricola]